MKKLLFIDLLFHSKTSSSNFLLDLLSKEYDIEIYYESNDGKFGGKFLPPIKYKKYDVLIFWQQTASVERILKYVKAESYCFFPMFDAVPFFDVKNEYSLKYWHRLYNFRIICFCKNLYDNLSNNGFDAYYFKYFPLPNTIDSWGDRDAVYFWRRTKDIGLEVIEKINNVYPLSQIHCHNVPDPSLENVPLIIPEALKDIITLSSWYPEKDDMRKDIEKCAIYIAPRLKEGIGMSFLEAMAMGRCVIAPDSPTMNEYIENGKTGILYDINNLNFSIKQEKVEYIQHQTLKYIENGYKEWQNKKQELCIIIQKSNGFHGNFKNKYLLIFYRIKSKTKSNFFNVLHQLRILMPEFIVKVSCFILRYPYNPRKE